MIQPLRRDQAEEVLRYWLASLKLEEALDLRPQARRPTEGTPRPRLDLPTPGQDYFKLPLTGAVSALLGLREPVQRALSGELSAFFETWLYGQYRRGEEQEELSQLLCFPVVHLPRGQLAGLLRCGVRLRFGSASGAAFRVPTWSERRRGDYPPVPDEVRVSQSARPEGVFPFFVDTRLLNQTLGVSSEAIDGLFDALRSQESLSEERMLELVLHTLEEAAGGEGVSVRQAGQDPASRVDALLERITSAMRRLLARGGRAQVYPLGIVIEGTQAKTSFHLQRDLRELIEAGTDATWQTESPLGAYLTGKALASAELPQRALFTGPALTPSQRRAADHVWGSRLSCVQGPPGTGKTTMILHLCAEALVRKVESWVDRRAMDESLFVVCSSNNRAVDNVMEGLGERAGLPLALRAGSRQVSEKVLVPQLRRALDWLMRAETEPEAARLESLERACDAFQATRARIRKLHGPRLTALGHEAERRRLATRLAELEVAAARDPQVSTESAGAGVQGDSAALLAALQAVERRLRALSQLCEARPSLAQVNAVARHYGRTAKKHLPMLEAALSAAGEMDLSLPLPPLTAPTDLAQLIAVWEEAVEDSLERLGALSERLERAQAHALLQRKRAERAQEITSLRERLATLAREAPREVPEIAHDDALSQELFQAALTVREAWARAHTSELCPALEAALAALEETKSLRSLYRSAPEHARRLQQLFGLWGATLLSLGNCFPGEPGSIQRGVIDEAGQCHPAHAVSMLLRAESVLVIGDAQQLTPVVEVGPDDDQRLLESARISLSAALLAPYRVHTRALASTQSVAERAVCQRHDLIDHFRCQPEIIAISDRLCRYGLNVHTPAADRLREAPFLSAPVAWIDVAGEQEALGGSLWNSLELQHTLSLVQRLLAAGITPAEIAIITPYRGQLERLRRGFAELRVPLEFSLELAEGDVPSGERGSVGLALGTVHRFQGGERSIVLFSSVVTRAASLPFLNGRPNLLNVAVSRARHHFVGVGRRDVLARGALTRVLTDAARVIGA